MSIAVSAVVKPSRSLLAMVGGMCVGIMFIGVVADMEQIGDWPLLSRVAMVGVCFFIALQGFYRIAKNRRTRHIDISGTGQIRLSEYRGLAGAFSENIGNEHADGVVHLMANSTLWPNLLLLRLRTDDGRICMLPILRDSVAANDFRSLSVACRWIAAHPADSNIL